MDRRRFVYGVLCDQICFGRSDHTVGWHFVGAFDSFWHLDTEIGAGWKALPKIGYGKALCLSQLRARLFGQALSNAIEATFLHGFGKHLGQMPQVQDTGSLQKTLFRGISVFPWSHSVVIIFIIKSSWTDGNCIPKPSHTPSVISLRKWRKESRLSGFPCWRFSFQ